MSDYTRALECASHLITIFQEIPPIYNILVNDSIINTILFQG